MRLILKLLKWLLILAVIVAIAGYLVLTFVPEFGAGGSGEPTPAMSSSKQFDSTTSTFKNPIATPPRGEGDIMANINGQFFGEEVREPTGKIPVQAIAPDSLSKDPGLRAYWLGHAGVLVEIDGMRVMVDPVFSERVSPFDFMGPKRFHESPIALSDMPAIDAVMISHDHYDHLDMKTAVHLSRQGTRYFVPPGIGNHLKRWNVPHAQITELDWNQSETLGALTLTNTPAQHYSGRGLSDWHKTLWASWTITGPKHRVYYSGDTGYSPHFKAIGKQYGPFDLTIIKIGAYGPGTFWNHIHMTVRDAMRAHNDVRGKQMLPVHWATFNLGFHEWEEPIEQALALQQSMKIDLLTPRPGEKVEIGKQFESTQWWRNLK